MEPKDIVDIIPLDASSNELANQIIAENDLKKVQDLTHLFNLNQAKKNVLRVIKMNSLLDKISDQMIERVEKAPDNFSNNDLLNYMQVTQSAIDRANKSLNLVDETPAIQLNQVNINVNDDDVLSRDSRERVTDAIKSIMKRLNSIQNSEKESPIIIKSDDIKVDDKTVLLNNQEEEKFDLIQGEN